MPICSGTVSAPLSLLRATEGEAVVLRIGCNRGDTLGIAHSEGREYLRCSGYLARR
jgi:hypothetical protein